MDKANVCAKFIEELKKADHMEQIVLDEKAKKKTVEHEIPEGLKEEAIGFVNELLSSGVDRHYIFEGQTSSEDISYHIRVEGDSVVLVREIDVGQRFHHYFVGPEAFLFGIYDMDELKKYLSEEKSR